MNHNAKIGLVVAAVIPFILTGYKPKPKQFAANQLANGDSATVQAAIDAAADGDTIVLPAGTFTWNAKITITKGITLQGQTTIDGSAQSPVISDKTIILDDTPRSSAMMLVNVTHTKNVRITGITFKHGPTVVGGGRAGIQFDNTDAKNGPNKTIRVDHCHFDHLGQGAGSIHFGHKYGWFEGVIDHCAFYEDKGYAVVFSSDGYWPANLPIAQYQDYWGNGSWADYAYFGSDKFMFVEDCHIERTGTGTTPVSATDTTGGARRVIRNNYIKNYVLGDHGTEGGSRDHRCDEVYDNTFEWTYAWSGTGMRGGNGVWHDNTFLGKAANLNKLLVPQSYRSISTRVNSIFWQSGGTSIWDKNDTEGNNTFVEGHPPFKFHGGSVGSWTTSNTTTGILTDAGNPNWATNKWIGYSVNQTDATKYPSLLCGIITGNTANTITVNFYGAADAPFHLTFVPGDSYGIYRVVQALDTAGSGKTDLVVVPAKTSVGCAYLAATGKPGYPHFANEPSIAWNNLHMPDNVNQVIFSNWYAIVENRDFFNLGSGFPANSTPQKVKDLLPASINGVAYTGTFTYPHPLVSGVGAPLPSPGASSVPSPTATPRLQQPLHPQPRPHLRRRLRLQRQPRLRRQRQATLAPSPTPTATSTIAPSPTPVEPTATPQPITLILRPGDSLHIVVPNPTP